MERPWFQWQSLQHPRKRIQWKPDHLTNTNWKMLGFAEARRPMKALFALTVLFSEPSRSKVAAHYQERTRGFAVQIILEGRGDQQKLNKNQTICCGRCTWRSSESWSVPNTCENAYITQKSMRVQTARLTMQCTRDNVWYYFALYKIYQNMCLATCWT